MKLALVVGLLVAVQGCILEQDTDYLVPGEYGIPSPSPEDCCSLCNGSPTCAAFTYFQGTCYFKNSTSHKVKSAGRVSGVKAKDTYMNGVNLGGWLVMETAWMYDQFSAPAELDWIMQLRKQGGDAFAIKTMQNHWAGYYPDATVDVMMELGITHARIPIGYWILEAPLSGKSMRDAGLQHEGFVTGGIVYLEKMLAKLKRQGIKAIIDLHALPGGASNCQSYAGVQVSQPYFWTASPPADNTTSLSACSGAGPYTTTRGNGRSWMQVGEEVLQTLGAWVVDLQANEDTADVVSAVEVANEPALGWAGQSKNIQAFQAATVPGLQELFRSNGLDISVALNYIAPNEEGMGAWVAAQAQSGSFDRTHLVVDYHQYYNWDGPLSWDQLNQRVCATNADNAAWAQYSRATLPVYVGEWSDCTNLGSPAFNDLADPVIRSHLAILWANQASVWASTPGVVGSFYWTLRMGSGWDPRPTDAAPGGHQVSGSAPDTSLPGFSPAVWNLLELARLQVVKPRAAYKFAGPCQCNGCSF